MLRNAFTTNALCNMYGDAGGTLHANFIINANGSISIRRGSTVVATSVATGLLVVGAWNYFEFTSTISDTVGVAEVRLNGVVVVTFTGDTKNAGTGTNIDTVEVVGITGANNCWVDDLYILNDLGSAPYNAPLGDVRVYNSVPTGAGANTGLTPSTGANWAAVDELPPSATDFVSGSTVGTKDTYALADLPAGVGTIFGVQVVALAKKTDAGARSIKPLVRTGGTDYAGSTVALSVSDASIIDTRQVSPNTSAAWTVANVNALEAGVEIA